MKRIERFLGLRPGDLIGCSLVAGAIIVITGVIAGVGELVRLAQP